MPDEDIENIDSQNDASADDENTDLEDPGSGDSSDDTEDGKSQDDGSEGDDDKGEDDKAPYTAREKRYYSQMKKAQGFKLVDGKWVKPQRSEPKPKSEPNGPDVNTAVQAALDKRDLDSLDLPDSVKTEIKNYAKLHGVSVLAAAKSPYITFIKSEAEKKAEAEDAAVGTKRKTQPKTNFAEMKPSDFDLSTKEGREQWGKYKQWLNSQ